MRKAHHNRWKIRATKPKRKSTRTMRRHPRSWKRRRRRRDPRTSGSLDAIVGLAVDGGGLVDAGPSVVLATVGLAASGKCAGAEDTAGCRATGAPKKRRN